jgi:hypothetical protein
MRGLKVIIPERTVQFSNHAPPCRQSRALPSNPPCPPLPKGGCKLFYALLNNPLYHKPPEPVKGKRFLWTSSAFACYAQAEVNNIGALFSTWGSTPNPWQPFCAKKVAPKMRPEENLRALCLGRPTGNFLNSLRSDIKNSPSLRPFLAPLRFSNGDILQHPQFPA